MSLLGTSKILTSIFSAITLFAVVFAQTSQPAATVEPKKGSIKFTAQIEVNGKTEKLDRKRFYLIRGDRLQNAELLKTLGETTVKSRDCYYADLQRGGKKISDELFCWLKTNDCDSPYCREIKTKEEAFSVPEFASAFNRGLREYRTAALALKWLTTNLPDEIRIGYYERQKPVLKRLVEIARASSLEAGRARNEIGDGFQSIMTDRLANAFFLDIDIAPLANKKTETYLITNLLPIIFGDTSYVWACEVEIDPAKPQAPVVLKNFIRDKKCEIFSKKTPEVCAAPACSKPPANPATTTGK